MLNFYTRKGQINSVQNLTSANLILNRRPDSRNANLCRVSVQKHCSQISHVKSVTLQKLHTPLFSPQLSNVSL